MSLDKFTKLSANLAARLDNNEQFLSASVAKKLAVAAENYPNDSTIISLANVIGKYADKNVMISRGQLRDLYNKFYVRNTKFAQVCQEELGNKQVLTSPKIAENQFSKKDIDTSFLGDQVLANALESVFDRKAQLKLYAKDLGEKAKSIVATTLDSWNLAPSKIDVSSGNDKFIIVRANYETPKGLTSFYVPLEIINNKIGTPTVLLGNGVAEDLNNKNVKSYIKRNAGEKLSISSENLLNTLTKAASEEREISDTELALARLNSKRFASQEFASNQILSQKIENEYQEIQLPKYSEFSGFEQHFTSPYGAASFNLGENAVKIGRDLIVRNLSKFGYKNSQISVSDSNENTIFYAVSLDSGKVAFTVPVKIENKKVQPPTVLMSKGSVVEFDSNNLRRLYANNVSDNKAAAIASPNYGLKNDELIENIRNAIKEDNLLKAEDALNVLASSGDAVAYAKGFKVYASALTGDEGSETNITSHPMYNEKDFYTTSASQLPISKQTGLPINKIYIDDFGNHRPLYRRAMSENYTGGFFMNYKIFG